MVEPGDPNVPSLPATFEHGDTEERRQSIIGLLSEPGEQPLALLVKGLGDEDWRVRKESVRVAVELAGRFDVVPVLVEAVEQGENVGLRNSAIEALGQLHATEALVSAMASAPDTARKFFIEALGDTRDPGAVPALVEEASAGDANTAASALDALARIGGPDAEAALRRHLASDDPFLRLSALDGLDRLGAEVPWEELSPLIGDRMIRRAALPVLGRCGHPDASEVLTGALGERSHHVVGIAAVALVHLFDAGPETAQAVASRCLHLPEASRYALRELLLDGDLLTRQAAAHILLLARDEPGLPGVMALVAGGTLPPEALSALGSWGASAARPLLEVQEHSHGLVRAAALEIASDLAVAANAAETDPSLAGHVRAAIREALHMTSDPEVVCAAARSLGAWAEARDAAQLVQLATGGSAEIALSCGAALEELARQHPEAVSGAMRTVTLEGPAGAALAQVVARVGGAEAIGQLQTGLSAQDPHARASSVDALAQIGGEQAAELIGFALADEDVEVRIVAARALGAMRSHDDQPLGSESLLLALGSDAPAVQAAAARALGRALEQRAVEPLRELIRSSAEGVAVAAMEALRELGDPALGELLVEALGHPDEEVVKQALSAIADASGPRVESQLSIGLEHPAWHVRGLAVRLLAERGTPEARYALSVRREREADPMVLRSIETALMERWGS